MPDAPSKKKQPGGFGVALRLAWDLGYIIAIPAVLFGFGGAYLDKLYGTEPFVMLIGFAIAVTLSGIGVARKVRQAIAPEEGLGE